MSYDLRPDFAGPGDISQLAAAGRSWPQLAAAGCSWQLIHADFIRRARLSTPTAISEPDFSPLLISMKTKQHRHRDFVNLRRPPKVGSRAWRGVKPTRVYGV